MKEQYTKKEEKQAKELAEQLEKLGEKDLEKVSWVIHGIELSKERAGI
ncbi:hypothetical protein [Allofustis seminis]|nr:hypothetical protein [Allofustis seminis]